jgi:hypothetical protein
MRDPQMYESRGANIVATTHSSFAAAFKRSSKLDSNMLVFSEKVDERVVVPCEVNAAAFRTA